MPKIFFQALEKNIYILKPLWKQNQLQIAKANLNNKIKAGGVIISDSKTLYRAVTSKIKTVCYWHKADM